MKRSHWERWTIDEIGEDVVRVLIAPARDGAPLEPLEAVRPRGSRAARDPGAVERTRQAVMDLELSVDDANDWGDETPVFMKVKELRPFLAVHRPGKPGLPTRRPPREGDVFMVEVPAGREGLESAADGGTMLRRYEGAGADVWDVTAAARQSVKRRYHDAVQAGSAETDRG